MGKYLFLKRMFIIGLSVGFIWLVAGCQPDSENLSNPTVTKHRQSATPVGTSTVVPRGLARSTPGSSPSSLPSTATETTIGKPSLQATTTISSDRSEFLPQISLFVGEAGSYPSIGVFDTQVNDLQIIDQPSETRSFGRPLWSQDKALLAYSQREEGAYSIKIYDPKGVNTRLLMAAQPQVNAEDESEPGMFLFGWSHEADWLAYDYTYESDPRDLHLVNRITLEDVSVDVPGRVFWFAWSPHSPTFAISNSESIYYGSPSFPTEMKIHQNGSELGIMNWHPEYNELIVASTENLASFGFNELWSLNLDTGEWIQIGSYPRIKNFAQSADGQSIAVYSSAHWLDLNLLTIVNANTLETIEQIELPEDHLFTELSWVDGVVSLTTKDNIYLIPRENAGQAYWVLEPDNTYFESFPPISFIDW